MDNFFQLISKNIKNIKNKNDFISKLLNIKFHYKKLTTIEPPKESNKFDIKNINQDNANKISNNQKIIKKRNEAIDLLRIITMIGIVYTHVLYQGKGLSKYNRYKNKLKSLYTYIFWHDNIYELISGIVG